MNCKNCGVPVTDSKCSYCLTKTNSIPIQFTTLPGIRRYYGKIFCGSDKNLLDSILHEIDHTDYSVYW